MAGKDSASFNISKKVCYAFLFLAIAAAVLVGVLVYYLGLPDCNGKDNPNEAAFSTPRPGSTPDSGASSEKVRDVRLPTHLLPEHYRVQLIPFIIPDNYTIRGFVEITMKCVESGGRNITLHITDITIDEDSVVVTKNDSGQALTISGHKYDKERDFYIVELGQAVEEGSDYVIKINFVANLQNGLAGFYRSSYENARGEDVTIATTQFQATDARKAFPCFDEPALKAKFEVSLGRLQNYSSISNMPIKEKGVAMADNNEYVWDHFEVSVPMSTYLVAFVVSDFEHELSPPTGNSVRFRIWARKNALDQVEYAKSIGAPILAFFEKYFDVPYPLPKQDMIAIPDFSAGAMENWGLITYRETALLFKEGVSAASNKQRIAVVISHELAHQWFGNLVTPSWWTDLWLNEGFASYVEYLGVDAVQPELKLMEQFVSMDLQRIMRLDALQSSHPISIPVEHPDEISEIFDGISYAKGASIIRMMNHFLTTDSFRRGLANYLKDFAYKAAEQDDLWRHLTAQAHQDGTLPTDLTVKAIMDTWTLQMGFPVVTVTRNYGSNSASVRQERFLAVKQDEADHDDEDYKWWVPITFTKPGGDFNDTYNKVWLSPSDDSVKVSGLPNQNEAVIFNVQQSGYYRVNYDRKNWELIAKQLSSNHQSIHVINRAQLMDDAFNLARAGLLDIQLAFDLTNYMANERSYIVWTSFLGAMSYVDSMLERTAAYGEFQKYMKRMIRPLFRNLGYDESNKDQHLDIFLRSSAVAWACQLKIEECTEKVRDDYRKWMDQLNPDIEEANPVNVNMRSTVYCNAIRNGGEAEWDFAWKRYEKSNVASEKSSILSALSCSNEVWILSRYLNMTITPNSGVRTQDAQSIFSGVSSNIIGRDMTFDFLNQNWDRIVEIFGGASFSMPSVVKSAMKNRNTEFELSELRNFYEKNKHNLSSGLRAAKQAIERAENNVKWMADNYQVIFDWLKEQNSSSRY